MKGIGMTRESRFATLWCWVVIVAAAGVYGGCAHREDKGSSQEQSRALGDAFRQMIEQSFERDRLKGRLLLQFAIDDSLARPEFRRAIYSIFWGSADENGDTAIYHADGRDVSYLMAVGGDLDQAKSAVILAALYGGEEDLMIEIVLAWNNVENRWDLLRSSTSGLSFAPFPAAR